MPFLNTNVAGEGVPKMIDYLCFKKGFIADRSTIIMLGYLSYDMNCTIWQKEDWFELCGTCLACKDEGQRLELKEKEKWYVDEVKRVKAIVGTVAWTKTRLLKVEYKQWKSLRAR